MKNFYSYRLQAGRSIIRIPVGVRLHTFSINIQSSVQGTSGADSPKVMQPVRAVTTDLHLRPRLRMGGNIPPLPHMHLRLVVTKNSKEQRPSREANTSSATKEISLILCNPKVHYLVHKSPPPVPILNQIDSDHAPPSYFCKIYFNIILPSMPGTSRRSLLTSFSTKSCIRLSSSLYVLHALPISIFLI